MLEVRHLRKEYKSKNGVVTKALDDVSLNFPETGMVFILGKSGSGKSTLLNVCGGLDRMDSGEIVIKGKSSADFSAQDFDSYRNTFVGFVFQEYNILDEFTVEENVALALELQNKKRDKEVINKILEDVEMTAYASRKPNTLSGGQKQRVAIARALVKEPEIIMADEPTGALDSKTGQQVFDTLKKLSQTKLVIVISHDRDFAEQYGDRIIELKDGKIISDQTRATEGDNARNVRFYGTDTVCVSHGAELTDEDMQSIRAFLAKSGGSAVISTSREKITQFKEDRPEVSVGSFENIKEQPQPKSYEPPKLIRSHMPMRHAVKMGASGLKTKPVRLVFTIFLSVIAFILFGLMSTLMLFDGKSVTVQTFVDASDKYLLLRKAYYYKYTYYDADGNIEYQDDNYSKNSTPYTLDEYKALAAKYAGTMAVSNWYGRIDNFRLGQYGEQFYSEEIEKAILVNDVAQFESGYGRKPEAADEIAISDFIYNGMAAKASRLADSNGNAVTISGPADLLYGDTNKRTLTIGDKQYKVVGIYKIDEVDGKFDDLKKAADDDTEFSGDRKIPEEWAKIVGAGLLPSAMFTEDALRGLAENNAPALNDLDYFEYTSGNLRIHTAEQLEYNNGWIYYVAKYSENNGKKGLLDIYDTAGNKVNSLGSGSVALHVSRALSIYYNAYERFIRDVEGSDEDRELRDAAREAARAEFVATLAAKAPEEKYFDEYSFNNDTEWWENRKNNEMNNARIEAENNGQLFDEQAWERDWIAENPAPQKDDRNDVDGYYTYYRNYEFVNDQNNYAETKSTEVGKIGKYNKLKNEIRAAAEAEFIAADPEPQPPSEEDASDSDWQDYNDAHNEWQNRLWQYLNDAQFSSDPLYLLQQAYYNGKTRQEIEAIFAQLNELFDGFMPEVGIINDYHEQAAPVKLVGMFYDRISDSVAYLSDDLYTTYLVESDYGSSGHGEYLTKYEAPADAFINTVYIPYEHTTSAVEEIVDLTYARGEDDSTAQIGNSQMEMIGMLIDYADVLSTAFLVAGLVLALFAFLLMFNFISASITAKKKDIGILRAIGARTSDVYKIFMSESFIIALICFVISTAGTLGLCFLLNDILTEGLAVSLFAFGPLSVLCILGVALVTAIISTVIPVALYSRKPPIESIRAL